jgi:hypothetical protein
MLSAIDKDPDAILPYRFDWTDWLDGDTIDNATFAVLPAVEGGLKIDDQTFDASGVATGWLSGGVPGQAYTVTCSVFTTAGAAHHMRDDRSILVRVKERQKPLLARKRYFPRRLARPRRHNSRPAFSLQTGRNIR